MAASQSREFVVRVPKQPELKNYSILKFGDSLNADIQNSSSKKISMDRENNMAPNMLEMIEQEFGAGTEFGKAAREEARKKRYGRSKKVYEHDKQPWTVEIGRREEGNFGKSQRCGSPHDLVRQLERLPRENFRPVEPIGYWSFG